ncbi:PH domain-containing protein [Catellatospora citrea]|uniref:PH (Pleckstrin Homology) domain-containing protein n=1 Tax=Catellatospora citrea TaxID=53366 RepID=A0A8J3KGV0_9ACTN|nr:PH domain-containing protein [Catellatospora citrea]RKE02700.1 PH (Pleckstrin Homology) domain-containing protein [Catellatospora citrea]GIF99532.1 hypothetical protein Cci01nite_46260 [Catellatospora citrea]
MQRIVIRPRIQRWILVVLFTVWGLLGLTYFTSGDVVAERNWFGLGLGVVLVVSGVLGIWRALRMGVVIDAAGVRVRGFDSRDVVTPWHAVQAVDCEQVDTRAGQPLYAPVLRLADGPVPVKALGSYSRDDAERKTAELRAFLPA